MFTRILLLYFCIALVFTYPVENPKDIVSKAPTVSDSVPKTKQPCADEECEANDTNFDEEENASNTLKNNEVNTTYDDNLNGEPNDSDDGDDESDYCPFCDEDSAYDDSDEDYEEGTVEDVADETDDNGNKISPIANQGRRSSQ